MDVDVDIVGNFAAQNDPSISLALANGAAASDANTTDTSNAITEFPHFDIYNPIQINLNQTGGTPIPFNST